jgi:amidohydrolase
VSELPITAPAAAPFAEVKGRAAAAVEAARAELLDLSHRIHANPEPAFEEHKAAAWCAAAVAGRGFRVELPAGSLATAVRGRLTGGLGADGPRIGILAEYDALPGLGHGCGHNTMAASGVGAAIALAAVRDSWAGEVVFLGTPAEERGSGKEIMLKDGLFDGLDAALLYHPCDRNHVECAPLASEDVVVVFKGLAAHASSDPWEGRNALDALIALFVSVGLWRQQLPPDCRVHGIVQEGGTAANIIPDRTRAWFMIRSANQRFYDEVMKPRFRQLCEAAALAAGVEVEVEFSGYASTMKHNRVLAQRWNANAAAYGIADDGMDATSGSTDMANVSWAVPAIHPDLAISDVPLPGHTIEFREAAGRPRADRTVLLAATLVAQTALDLLLDPSVADAAWREFREGAAR